MNNFSINITIEDLICSKNCKDKSTTSETITSISEVISLKNGYILNIVNVTNTHFTIILQNGINTIIRNVFQNVPIRICIPCKCANHIVTINGTITNIA